MDYEQARRIRNKDYSLTKLITTNIRQGAGAGAAIKEAFKEKFDFKTRTQAKITGIKERFDPLNIAKFLTGGSNFAPALLGRMLGRSQKDINYFSGGRAKPYENATKVGKVEGDESGMTEILDKIYTFMKKSQEDDIKHQELQNNHREEEMMKADKKHKELLKALSKLTGNNVTAEKVTGEQGSIGDILSDILAAFGGLNSLKNAKWLARFITSPTFLIPLLIAGIYYGVEDFKKRKAIQAKLAAAGDVEGLRKTMGNEEEDTSTTSDIQRNMIKNELRKANTKESLAALAKIEEGEKSKHEELSKYDKFLEDKGYYRSMGYRNLENKKVPEDLKRAAQAYASGQTGTTETPPAPPAEPPAQPAAPNPPPVPLASEPKVSALPTETPNAGQQLVNATNENNNAKLADLTASPATNTVNTSSTNVAKSSNPITPLPPVRNLEETFQRMIMNSTKVV